MQFILKAFYQLEGLGAASGLVYRSPRLYLVSDYSSYLYCYDSHTQQLDKFALFADQQEFLAKPEKFDFEAIVEHDNALLLFGSGSTQRRNSMVRCEISHLQANTKHQFTPALFDLSALYQKFKAIAQLNEDELNIEGVIHHQAKWLFFQRANGAQAQSGIFMVQDYIFKDSDSAKQHSDFTEEENKIISNNCLNEAAGVAISTCQAEKLHPMSVDTSHPIRFVPVALPVVNQVSCGFTDAIVVGETIYFLASAENSSSTYHDGEVLGSYIGCMDVMTYTIQEIQLLSTRHKFEGLTLYQQTADKIEFLLCEDNDTDQLSTTIYKLTLPLQS